MIERLNGVILRYDIPWHRFGVVTQEAGSMTRPASLVSDAGIELEIFL